MITLIRTNPATGCNDYWRTEGVSVDTWIGASEAARLSFLEDQSNLSSGRFYPNWEHSEHNWRANLMTHTGWHTFGRGAEMCGSHGASLLVGGIPPLVEASQMPGKPLRKVKIYNDHTEKLDEIYKKALAKKATRSKKTPATNPQEMLYEFSFTVPSA